MKIVLRLGRNLTNFVHLAYWCSETDWSITTWISEDISAIISVHLVKILVSFVYQ